jgi:hypothetical protein
MEGKNKIFFRKKKKKEDPSKPLHWFKPRLQKKRGLNLGLDNDENMFI